jgi:hypothetical protein
MRQLCQFIVRKKKAVSPSSLLKDSKTKNKKKSNKDSISEKNNEPFSLDERREEQMPKVSMCSWEPQVKKDANCSTRFADLVSSEAVSSSTNTRDWLQAHEATLLECGFQMVGSIKATTQSMGNDFSNEDIIDELISTFQGYGPRLF